MKTPVKIFSFLIGIAILNSCGSNQNSTLNVKFNKSVTQPRVVEFKNIEKNPSLKSAIEGNFQITQGDVEIQSQIYFDPISKTHSLLFLPDPKSNQKLVINKGKPSSANFPALSYAELWKKEGGEFVDRKYIGGSFVQIDSIRVPDECTDHSYYLKYEGPGWESNLVGYRFYLDWRNANDIYGKKTEKMILKEVGQDGYESYHNMNDWGMDVFKVGNALGLGTIAYWNGKSAERVAKTDSLISKICTSGPLRATIQTDYYGWQTNDFKTHFTSWLSIDGNSRLTHNVLKFDTAPANICTGINRDTTCEYIQIEEGNWIAIATFGKQSLNKDNLGIVVFVEKKYFDSYQTDDLNYVVVLKPEMNSVSWYFGAAWELDKSEIKTADEFKEYIDEQLELLNDPDKVK